MQLPQHTVYSPKDIVTHIKANVDHSSHELTSTGTTSIASTSVEHELDRLSRQERARHVIDEGKISVDTKLHTFTVMGSTCPHLVILFPKEICTCASTTQCYHILAAKLAIGQKLDDSKKKINLTQLHRNSRSRGSKKSGRIHPHPLDCEVIPAPDAMVPAQDPVANSSVSIGDNASVPTSKKPKEDDTSTTSSKFQGKSIARF